MHDNEVFNYFLPVGPQHPALKESVHLRFGVEGETVRSVDFRLGYAHRGIEGGLASIPYSKGLFMAERICGICCVVHSLNFCNAFESIAKVEIPDRARHLRTIMAELERVHSHLLWAGVAAHEIGYDTLFHYCWRDREHVLDFFEKSTGNRVQHSISCLGGVRHDLTPEMLKQLEALCDTLDSRIDYYEKAFTRDATLRKRCRGIGTLPKKDALELAAVGPTARASGVAYDIRSEEPYEAYFDFEPVVDEGCDVFARIKVRVAELRQSVKIIRSLLRLPTTPLKVNFPVSIPPGEGISRCEAPRGELFYFARTNLLQPDRVRIRTPTYANFASLPPMLIGQKVADIPIIVASIDPCICCTDRFLITDEKGARVVDRHDLCPHK